MRWPEGYRPKNRTILTLILLGAGIWSFVAVGGVADLNSGGLDALRAMLVWPDLSPDYLRTVAGDALLTVGYATAAMSIAASAGIVGAVAASGALVRRRGPRVVGTVVVRTGLAILRSIHELVWALLFVNAFGLSPWAGILAIGIPYAGTVGKIVGQHLEDVPHAPLVALEATGASPAHLLLYGRVPQIAPDVVGYLVYRFECAIRAAAVLSFVGLGGLGLRIEVALDDLDYAKAWTPTIALILLVVAVDVVGGRTRRRFAA